MTTKVPVVTDEMDFIGQLCEADILLFDKLSSLNRLVQWADNRPAGHCAVWHGDGVYEATIKTLPSGDKKGGIFHTRLSELLEVMVADERGNDVGLVRTVTAMRYRNITDVHRRQVLDYADARRSASDFAVQEMVLLAPFALQRSYVGRGKPGNDVMRGLIKACKFYAQASVVVAEPAERMFCSQLVYRSYKSAGLKVEIIDPLYTRYNVPRARGHANQPYSSLEGDIEERDAAVMLDEYSTFFEEQVLTQPQVVAPADIAAGHRPQGLAGPVATARGSEPQTGDQYRERGWSDLVGRRGRAPQFDDMITPGDFWASPSLEPVAILHRPPDR